ncbi:MAG: DUF418 domain-containing protein [Janthinobacterium lividum]
MDALVSLAGVIKVGDVCRRAVKPFLRHVDVLPSESPALLPAMAYVTALAGALQLLSPARPNVMPVPVCPCRSVMMAATSSRRQCSEVDRPGTWLIAAACGFAEVDAAPWHRCCNGWIRQIRQMKPPQRPPVREQRIDALRGLAVFGILLVNIWSFTSGFESLHYGLLPPAPTTLAALADRAAVFFTALLAEQKFYPIFAFLFGAGFALQVRTQFRQCRDWACARQLFRRRLRWLLCCGLLHGALVWFGDILSLYGSAGFLLVGLAGARWRVIRLTLVFWLSAWLILLAVNLAAALPLSADGASGAAAGAMIERAQQARAIYTSGTWMAIGQRRLLDFSVLLRQSLYIVPQVVSLFVLGLISVRRGWLTRPHRHVPLWRRVRLLGLLIGVPVNLLWACAALLEAIAPAEAPRYTYLVYAVMPLAGTCLGAAYVASFMLMRAAALQWCSRWLAPAGRMTLSDYLCQSLLCVLLLQGAGLGWGALLSPGQTMLLFAAIVLLQLLVCRWWLARFKLGPLEMLYRWQTASPFRYGRDGRV